MFILINFDIYRPVIVEPSNHMKICMHKALEKYNLNDLEDENPHPSFKSLLYASLFFYGILSVKRFTLIYIRTM